MEYIKLKDITVVAVGKVLMLAQELWQYYTTEACWKAIY